MAHTHEHDHASGGEEHDAEHEAMQDAIEECLNCHAACTIAVQYCLSEGGSLANAELVGILLDCAEICQVSANFMLRGSPYYTVTCGACAELCRACEDACRSVTGDEQLEHAADLCAACATACEAIVRAATDDEEG